MSETISQTISGQTTCLCGSIKITATKIEPNFSACHCDTCRKWGGAPYFSLRCGVDVNIEGAENITRYESSAWAFRGFCSSCGTHLFYQIKETGEYNMPVGLFLKLEGLKMDVQYYADQRPDYYCFSNATREMTKAEVERYFS